MFLENNSETRGLALRKNTQTNHCLEYLLTSRAWIFLIRSKKHRSSSFLFTRAKSIDTSSSSPPMLPESQLMSIAESTCHVSPSSRWTSGLYRFMGTKIKEITFFNVPFKKVRNWMTSKTWTKSMVRVAFQISPTTSTDLCFWLRNVSLNYTCVCKLYLLCCILRLPHLLHQFGTFTDRLEQRLRWKED